METQQTTVPATSEVNFPSDQAPAPLPTQIRFEDIFGNFRTTTTVPTDVPKTVADQVRIYVDSLTSPTIWRLYWYDIKSNVWKYSSLPVSLSSDVSGTLPIANGGTGQTTATAAFNALDPQTTKGDIITHDGSNSVRYAVGANGTQLRADAAQTNGIFWEQPFGIQSTDFGASTRFSFNQSGGATRSHAASGVGMSTPAGGNAYGELVMELGGSANFTAYARPSMFSCQMYLNALDTSCVAYIGIGRPTVALTGITYTPKHVGFKLINSGGTITLYGTVSNGSTESTVTISTVSAGSNLDLVAYITNSGTVNFWARNDGAAYSVATISTNVPAGNTTEQNLSFQFSNSSTTNNITLNIYAASYQR